MKTMHFHIAQTGLFLGQFGAHANCPGMQCRSNNLLDSFCFCGYIIGKALDNRNCCFLVGILPDDISTPHTET